jgi:outer membrane protein OmpA-like peptidoglycan-associated protein
MSRWIVFSGIIALLATGFFATLDKRGEGALRSVQHVPADLAREVNAALGGSGLGWASVRMDGQRAILSGEAPSELDRADAIEIARRAAGRGGALWGPVTSVDGSAITLQTPLVPYRWSARRGAGQSVRFAGAVPSQRLKREVAEEAKKLFPQGVADDTRVASGYPTGDWKGSVMLGLMQLKRLDDGELQFNDGALVLVGQVADDGLRAEIETEMSKVRRPLSGSAQLMPSDRSQPPLPAEPAEGELPEAPALEVQAGASVNCQRVVNDAMRTNAILFASGSAEIDAAGAGVIAAMVRAAQLCPDLRLRVTGHSDGMPAEGDASAISLQRANAVSALLRSSGLAPERLSTTGLGASQPVAASAGLNRRVEISVIP